LIYEKIYSYLSIHLSIYLSIYLSISLNGQVIHSNEKEKGTSIQRNASFNVEEIKVRWKKAALENCTGVPCVVTPPAPSFTCGPSTVSDYDGNIYETVAIVGTGVTQCWTKTNLKVTKYNDGTVIGDSTNSTSNPCAPFSGARTGFKEGGSLLSGYVETFGYLYNWYAVNDTRKLCPAGWRVPTDSDWNKLVISLHSGTPVADTSSTSSNQSTTAGTVMKSAVTTNPSPGDLVWNSGSPGTNTSGFSVLPGGFRRIGGSFINIRNAAWFWSATGLVNGSAWYRSLSNLSGVVVRLSTSKSVGASVRCLRD
jgi:uncharacterized protein (TIGR02145 family)